MILHIALFTLLLSSSLSCFLSVFIFLVLEFFILFCFLILLLSFPLFHFILFIFVFTFFIYTWSTFQYAGVNFFVVFFCFLLCFPPSHGFSEFYFAHFRVCCFFLFSYSPGSWFKSFIATLCMFDRNKYFILRTVGTK